MLVVPNRSFLPEAECGRHRHALVLVWDMQSKSVVWLKENDLVVCQQHLNRNEVVWNSVGKSSSHCLFVFLAITHLQLSCVAFASDMFAGCLFFGSTLYEFVFCVVEGSLFRKLGSGQFFHTTAKPLQNSKSAGNSLVSCTLLRSFRPA